MNEPNLQNEKPKNELRLSQEQYEMLKRCSDKEDMSEWNQWRKDHPDEVVSLQGTSFEGWWLQNVNFMHGSLNDVNFEEVHLEGAVFEQADLQNACFAGASMNRTRFWHANARNANFSRTSLVDTELGVANFENCDFCEAVLVDADFTPSQLNGAKFTNTNLTGCSMRACAVDGSTRFWNCRINRYSKKARFTDLTGILLENLIIDPSIKQLLEYNIRRMNWEAWYKYKNWQESKDERHIVDQKLRWFIRLFWSFSDYGRSTGRVAAWFFGLAFAFAGIYYLSALVNPPGIVSNLIEGMEGLVPYWLVPFRAIYFSIVTMTTLGFGDMHANSQNIWGHILLTIQVILGYVLLGALVTRFAVLFTAGGPAGTFADDKRQKTDDRNQKTEN